MLALQIESHSEEIAREDKEKTMPSRAAEVIVQGLPIEILLPSLESEASLQRMRGKQSMRARQSAKRVQTVSGGRTAHTYMLGPTSSMYVFEPSFPFCADLPPQFLLSCLFLGVITRQQHVVKGWLLSICFQEIVISLLCSSSMGSGKQQGQGFPPSFDKKLNPKPVS